MKLTFALAALLLLPIFALTAGAVTNQPTIQGTIYDAAGDPAPGAIVTVTVNNVLVNTTTADGSGQYSVVPDISFSTPQPVAVDATLGNQTNTTLSTLVDGSAPYTIDVHMNAPPRYNVTVHVVDVNTDDPVASALVIASTNPYGTAVEIGSNSTNSTGDTTFNLAIDDSPFRFTAIKSGYPTNGVVRGVAADTALEIELGIVPVVEYGLTMTITNYTSGLPLAGAALTVQSSDRGSTVTTGTSDIAGHASFTLPSAQYWIVATCTGYTSNETFVNLDSSKSVTLPLSHGVAAATPLSVLPLLGIAFLAAAIVYRRKVPA